ncbi:hypothetical protein PG996_008835 [Apiospora saccharicola]|uniref:Uncharacterized protein n=1 Tax=Apiospora saccharicola TaxID=335842 RepID=A0ABR1UZ23_9PEZI
MVKSNHLGLSSPATLETGADWTLDRQPDNACSPAAASFTENPGRAVVAAGLALWDPTTPLLAAMYLQSSVGFPGC